MVAILDADKEGFLRSETSLIQMIGRACRNSNSEVILYADKETPSMKRAIEETDRRRAIQVQYNEENGITPATIQKAIHNNLKATISARQTARQAIHASEDEYDRAELLAILEKEMLEAAEALEFEKAARLRDRLAELKEAPEMVASGAVAVEPVAEPAAEQPWQPRSKKKRKSG
jgi:excinuclease ABC subunit B